MRLIYVLLAIVFLVPRGAVAAELIMFHSPACEWCEIWEEEVGIVYGRTGEGRAAPLRRVSIHDFQPADIGEIEPVHFTPTFILLENDREIGRITGYPGEAHFWALLQSLINKNDSATAGCPLAPRLVDIDSESSKETTTC